MKKSEQDISFLTIKAIDKSMVVYESNQLIGAEGVYFGWIIKSIFKYFKAHFITDIWLLK